MRATTPGGDTATVHARVWQDGPPWFSCAEVVAKLDRAADSASVRDQVGNWRHLVRSGWVVLRDSAHGAVSDPGWCTATLSPKGLVEARDWSPRPDGAFPTGSSRRGWVVPVGRRRYVVDAARAAGPDSATVRYAATVSPNANGSAIGADRDSAWFGAALRRADGRWRVVGAAPEAAASSRRGGLGARGRD
ncbi:MAG TPA: hypothetical protein VNB64_02610 [Solirubrobacteraceae bacterium]|nr:hypothetical protein [Solirubrobacteraceae bacterium]